MTINSRIFNDFEDIVSFYVSDISSNLHSLMDPITYNYSYHQTNPAFPPIDVIQSTTDKFIEIRMAIAGFKKENLSIETVDNSLIVSGELVADYKYSTNEIIFVKKCLKADSFTKKFVFPDNRFDFRNPDVTLKDGMLTIYIKKNPELTAKDKKIEIK